MGPVGQLVSAAYATVWPQEKGPQSIEPFTAIIAFAVLSKLPEGTKIGVNSDRVYFSPPGENQWKERAADRLKRNDIVYFEEPITEAIKQTTLFERSDSHFDKQVFLNIFNDAISGLNKLIDIYEKRGKKSTPDRVCPAIRCYKLLLEAKVKEMAEGVKPVQEEEARGFFGGVVKANSVWTPTEIAAVADFLNKGKIGTVTKLLEEIRELHLEKIRQQYLYSAASNQKY